MNDYFSFEKLQALGADDDFLDRLSDSPVDPAAVLRTPFVPEGQGVGLQMPSQNPMQYQDPLMPGGTGLQPPGANPMQPPVGEASLQVPGMSPQPTGAAPGMGGVLAAGQMLMNSQQPTAPPPSAEMLRYGAVPASNYQPFLQRQDQGAPQDLASILASFRS